MQKLGERRKTSRPTNVCFITEFPVIKLRHILSPTTKRNDDALLFPIFFLHNTAVHKEGALFPFFFPSDRYCLNSSPSVKGDHMQQHSTNVIVGPHHSALPQHLNINHTITDKTAVEQSLCRLLPPSSLNHHLPLGISQASQRETIKKSAHNKQQERHLHKYNK